MRIINEFSALPEAGPVTAIALGTFDGVHAGHQRIISRAVELARRAAGTSMVFTSANHPLSCIAPAKCPRLLTTGQEKAGLISTLGVDWLAQIPFNPEFMQLSPVAFLELLRRKFAPRYLVVGANYTFGSKGAGNVGTLAALSPVYDFELVVPESVCCDGAMVSSARIRRAITTGALAAAERMLKRPVQATGYLSKATKTRFGAKDAKVYFDFPDTLTIPGDGLYNLRIATGHAAAVSFGLAKFSRVEMATSGVTRYEIQFLGGAGDQFLPAAGCHAKVLFTESLSEARMALNR